MHVRVTYKNVYLNLPINVTKKNPIKKLGRAYLYNKTNWKRRKIIMKYRVRNWKRKKKKADRKRKFKKKTKK